LQGHFGFLLRAQAQVHAPVARGWHGDAGRGHAGEEQFGFVWDFVERPARNPGRSGGKPVGADESFDAGETEETDIARNLAAAPG